MIWHLQNGKGEVYSLLSCTCSAGFTCHLYWKKPRQCMQTSYNSLSDSSDQCSVLLEIKYNLHYITKHYLKSYVSLMKMTEMTKNVHFWPQMVRNDQYRSEKIFNSLLMNCAWLSAKLMFLLQSLGFKAQFSYSEFSAITTPTYIMPTQ